MFRCVEQGALAHPWFKNAPDLTKPLSQDVLASLTKLEKSKEMKRVAMDVIAYSLTPTQIKGLLSSWN